MRLRKIKEILQGKDTWAKTKKELYEWKKIHI